MRKTWRSILICTLLAIIIYLFIYYSETRTLPNIIDQWYGIILAVILINIVGFGLVYVNTVLNKYIGWQKKIQLRFIMEISAGILLAFLSGAIFIFTYLDYIYIETETTFFDFIYEGSIKFGIISFVVSCIYSLLNFSIYSYNQYSVGQIESLAYERIQLDLRFEALKSQLNPHFLFNALNTISSLIYIDIKQAESYIRHLARTYDYILSANETKLVVFSEELELVKAYFFMHKVRYENRIELIIDEKLSEINGYLPPLVLQILVENALKHTTITEENPLKIEIFKSGDNRLVVRNNVVGHPEIQSTMNVLLNKQKESESYKIGLSNIQNRYKYITNQKIEVMSGKHFTVKIPIIKEFYEK